MKAFRYIAILVVLMGLLVSCTAGPAATPTTAVSATPLFYGAFATPIEEPWDGVIHQALQQAATEGKITYEYQDNLGYSGDLERVLREVADTKKPAAIFGPPGAGRIPGRL